MTGQEGFSLFSQPFREARKEKKKKRRRKLTGVLDGGGQRLGQRPGSHPSSEVGTQRLGHLAISPYVAESEISLGRGSSAEAAVLHVDQDEFHGGLCTARRRGLQASALCPVISAAVGEPRSNER